MEVWYGSSYPLFLLFTLYFPSSLLSPLSSAFGHLSSSPLASSPLFFFYKKKLGASSSLFPSYPLSCPLASSEERGEEARGQDRAIGREEKRTG
jgi:hypothetical protein